MLMDIKISLEKILRELKGSYVGEKSLLSMLYVWVELFPKINIGKGYFVIKIHYFTHSDILCMHA